MLLELFRAISSYPFQGILETIQHSLPVGNPLPIAWYYHYVESTPPVINKIMDLFITIIHNHLLLFLNKAKNMLC